ncbi:epimerase [Burkholderia sp. Nafp2/4-1b]|uniref:epimerase n=1 Tax=Burkholderia sp. Nafp2/4-1b TaxID=2116686 RepID=UPI000EF94A7A|nr:epimerase [Burkholderia sp. Nafp2/4-1b]RKU01296.1 epimerase [Burkholderia sp. Nafp2/4-1b]
MKIILTGATGFAGGEVLRQALADPDIAQVTVLTRRSVGFVHPKLREVLMRDFLDYEGRDLAGYTACIWCLGTSQAGAAAQAYMRVTLDYPLAAARAMFAANPRLRFCFVSGRSADPTEQRRSLFACIKGRAERQLSELDAPIFIFRPGYIRPTARSGPRKDLARFLAPVGALFSLLGADYSVDCDQFARCLLDVAKHGADRALLVNSELRAWPMK